MKRTTSGACSRSKDCCAPSASMTMSTSCCSSFNEHTVVEGERRGARAESAQASPRMGSVRLLMTQVHNVADDSRCRNNGGVCARDAASSCASPASLPMPSHQLCTIPATAASMIDAVTVTHCATKGSFSRTSRSKCGTKERSRLACKYRASMPSSAKRVESTTTARPRRPGGKRGCCTTPIKRSTMSSGSIGVTSFKLGACKRTAAMSWTARTPPVEVSLLRVTPMSS
mmetsp:Transcript_58560/g.155934  ORF Transcript_58560/g.155934 Transcript_58560/m.155934 type:complete len:229 (-) Transcript_58560:123-809(-)